MSAATTQEIVKTALAQVIDDTSGRDVVSAGLISGIVVRAEKVGFLITVAPDAANKEELRKACELVVSKLPGVGAVTAVLTAHNDQPIPPAPQSGYTAPRERATWNLTPVEGVNRVIAV